MRQVYQQGVGRNGVESMGGQGREVTGSREHVFEYILGSSNS